MHLRSVVREISVNFDNQCIARQRVVHRLTAVNKRTWPQGSCVSLVTIPLRSRSFGATTWVIPWTWWSSSKVSRSRCLSPIPVPWPSTIWLWTTNRHPHAPSILIWARSIGPAPCAKTPARRIIRRVPARWVRLMIPSLWSTIDWGCTASGIFAWPMRPLCHR